MKIKSNVKAGGISIKNHNEALVRVKSNVKAGGIRIINHNQSFVQG